MVKKIKKDTFKRIQKNDLNEVDKKMYREKHVRYVKNKDLKSVIKNIGIFLWHDDSVWSWLANILVAYLFIVFIFYPALGLVFNTTHPLVAVVSGSMEHMVIDHNGNNPNLCGKKFTKTDLFVGYDDYWDTCGKWYERNYNITKSEFSEFYFRNGFNKGDIIFIFGSKPEELEIGDVIVFQTNIRSEPIIHRIVNIRMLDGELTFTTKGDHNSGTGSVDYNIKADNVIGKGIFRVPFLGWFKIWVTNLIT